MLPSRCPLVAPTLLLAALSCVLFVGTAASSGARTRSDEAARERAHQVVFELTSGDEQVWEGLMNNVQNVQAALGSTEVEVVAHGAGLALLIAAENGDARERLERISRSGVVFAACENTMEREGVEEEDLVPFATTVDSGVAEVVRRQELGWSYVRTDG